MAERIAFGICILLLVVEIVVLRSRLNKIHDYIESVFNLSNKIAKQHDDLKEQAREIKTYFDIVHKSNEAVDAHYSIMRDKMNAIDKLLENFIKQEEKKDGMAV